MVLVHFRRAGSDYNPQRNPNNGEGAGDSDNPEAGSRADRQNIVDMVRMCMQCVQHHVSFSQDSC